MTSDQAPFLFSLIVFMAVFSLFAALLVMRGGDQGKDRDRIRQRIKGFMDHYEIREPTSVHLLRQRYRTDLNWLDQWILRIPSFDNVVSRGDLKTGIRKIQWSFVATLVLAVIVTRSISDMVPQPVIAWGIGVLIFLLPYFYLRMAAHKRLAEFEKQLPEALDAITRALKAGYTFNDTMALVANEMEAPLGQEFRWVCDEINAGFEVRSALLNLLDRVPSVSLMAFTTTVLLQRETGGNLSETLGKISQIIRKRFTFHRTIKTLTAEARMSAWVLAMLPFIVFMLVFFVNPDYVMLLVTEPVGKKMIMMGLLLMMAGGVWLRTIINIEI